MLVTCSFTACMLVGFLAQGEEKGQGTEIPKSSSVFPPGYSLLAKHQIHKVTQSTAIPWSKVSCRGSQASHARKRAHIFILMNQVTSRQPVTLSWLFNPVTTEFAIVNALFQGWSRKFHTLSNFYVQKTSKLVWIFVLVGFGGFFWGVGVVFVFRVFLCIDVYSNIRWFCYTY